MEILSHPSGPAPGSSIEATRRFYDDFNSQLVERMRLRFTVDIKSETIGGVKTDVVTPTLGIPPTNKARVLINLHGGGFMWGAHSGGLVESIPIASIGKIKVITVDYREAPENSFPAGSEDVAAVYAELLKTYKSRNIGIYGGSQGEFSPPSRWLGSKLMVYRTPARSVRSAVRSRTCKGTLPTSHLFSLGSRSRRSRSRCSISPLQRCQSEGSARRSGKLPNAVGEISTDVVD